MNILKNRIAARDYMQQIPEERVYLDAYVKMPNTFYQDCNSQDKLGSIIQQASTRKDQHMKSYGLDALSCGTIACVAGWLWTMPEYQDFKKERGYEGQNSTDLNLDLLAEFLGFDNSVSVGMTFATKMGMNACLYTDKEIAMQRLNKLVVQSGGE